MHLQLHREIRRWNGVLPTTALIEAGWTYRQIRMLCAQGTLQRVRPGWVAAPEAATELVRAAKYGGFITCVTQARRLNLWVTDDDHLLHLGVAMNGRKPCGDKLKLHWGAPLVERDPRALEDHLVNVLAAVADCLPKEDALGCGSPRSTRS